MLLFRGVHGPLRVAQGLLAMKVGGTGDGLYRYQAPAEGIHPPSAGARFWWVVWLAFALIGGCTRPVNPNPDAAILACRAGMAKLPREDALVALGKACKDLYVEPGCRDAWGGLDQKPRAERTTYLIESCRDAYCAKLTADPPPTLCSDPKLPDVSYERVLLWNELNQAILVRDVGARRSTRLVSELSIIEALDSAPR